MTKRMRMMTMMMLALTIDNDDGITTVYVTTTRPPLQSPQLHGACIDYETITPSGEN